MANPWIRTVSLSATRIDFFDKTELTFIECVSDSEILCRKQLADSQKRAAIALQICSLKILTSVTFALKRLSSCKLHQKLAEAY